VTRTPLTIVGGFLGAGKTTLVNHILRQANGPRIAVLVNDFGAVNIDAALIADRAGGVVRLTNGCLCCSIGDSFVDALIAVMRGPLLPDHVVIETSGVADPGRVAELAYLDPAFSLHGIVVLVDAEQGMAQMADRYVGDTVLRQIEAADLLVLNKIDLCGADGRFAIETRLREIAPRSRLLPAREADLPLAVLLGFEEAHWGAFLETAAPSHHPARRFASFVFEADRPFCEQKLRAVLETLPTGVLRMKGFARTEAAMMVLQAVGARWELRPGAAEGETRTRLAVIGVADTVDQPGLRERLSRALVDAG